MDSGLRIGEVRRKTYEVILCKDIHEMTFDYNSLNKGKIMIQDCVVPVILPL